MNIFLKTFVVSVPVFIFLMTLLLYLKALAIDVFIPAFWSLDAIIMLFLFIYATVILVYIK